MYIYDSLPMDLYMMTHESVMTIQTKSQNFIIDYGIS